MKPVKVLCVDDELVVRRVIERIFHKRPEEVHLCGTAAEAVEALASGGFNLVISDIRMPGGGGEAVARAARDHGVPVLFITGYAESGPVQEFIEAGAPVVRKPFTPKQLIAAVEEVLRVGGVCGPGAEIG